MYLFPIKYTILGDGDSWIMQIFRLDKHNFRNASNQMTDPLLGLSSCCIDIFLLKMTMFLFEFGSCQIKIKTEQLTVILLFTP